MKGPDLRHDNSNTTSSIKLRDIGSPENRGAVRSLAHLGQCGEQKEYDGETCREHGRASSPAFFSSRNEGKAIGVAGGLRNDCSIQKRRSDFP